MKTITICFFLLTAAAGLARGGELESRYAASMDARIALTDSIAAAIAPLDSEELLFDSDANRKHHFNWVSQTHQSIEQLRTNAEAFKANPSLYPAVRFELGWQRLNDSFLEALTIARRLSAFGIIDPTDGVQPEEVDLYDRTKATRATGGAFLMWSLEMLEAIMDYDMAQGRAAMAYIRAASEELERVGWNP